jgi:hypothetical protein
MFIKQFTSFDHFLVNLMTVTWQWALWGILCMFPTEFSTGNVEKIMPAGAGVLNQKLASIQDTN